MTSLSNCKQFGTKTDQITLRRAHSNFQARLLFNLDSPHYRKNELTFRISWMVLDSATQDDCKYSIHIHMTRYHGSGLLQTRQKMSCARGGGGVLPEKLGGGVRLVSQNPYPIYDQNLRYSLPCDVTFKSKPCF